MSHTVRWWQSGVLFLALAMVACAPREPWPTTAPPTVVPTPAVLPTPTPGPQPTVLLPTLTPTSPAAPQRWEPAGHIDVTYPGRLIWAFGGQVLGVIAEDGLYLARVADLIQARIITITAPSRLLDFSSDGHTMALTSD